MGAMGVKRGTRRADRRDPPSSSDQNPTVSDLDRQSRLILNAPFHGVSFPPHVTIDVGSCLNPRRFLLVLFPVRLSVSLYPLTSCCTLEVQNCSLEGNKHPNCRRGVEKIKNKYREKSARGTFHLRSSSVMHSCIHSHTRSLSLMLAQGLWPILRHGNL